MSKEKILTIDDLPMHKDTYFFGYGIDIDKPYEMANQIVKLRKENQELKKQLEELDFIVGLRQKRNLIHKFDKEYDEEDKRKNPNRDYVGIMPDAEEVYKRYYAMKKQQKEFIEWLEHYKKALLNVGSKRTIDCVLEKYKEIVGGSNANVSRR